MLSKRRMTRPRVGAAHASGPRSNGTRSGRRAELAHAYAKVPPGKALIASNATADWLQIDLVNALGGLASELRSVRVLQRVGSHHPLVRQFRAR
jgi:hypothetical protein